MKFLAMLCVVAAFIAGWFAQPLFKHSLSSSDGSTITAASGAEDDKQPLYWVAPMDPNYRRDKPGKSPMGMDLVPVYEDDAGQQNAGGVTISATMEHNLGVRTATVEEGPFELPIKAVGTIVFNEDRLVHVHSRVAGWIEKTWVKSMGDPVKKGQRLFELYSPQLVNAQEEYLAALGSNNNLLKTASKNRLIALGLTKRQISRLEQRKGVSATITHYAEQGGVVASLGVREGMYIKPALEIMTIGALDEVWLIAEIFERQAGWIKAGQRAEISLPALPGIGKTGVVDYIYPVLNQDTRTLQVRLRIPNEDRLLKPNMFADVKLLASVGEKVIAIPREAVIRSGTHSRVVLALGDGQYRPALVRPGVESDEKIQILNGLEAGQQVVVSAQFLIDSESNIDMALAALDKQKKQSEMPQQVMAMGTIEGFQPDQRLLTITHDPVEEWQWPTMKMDFKLAESVDFPALSEGQRIEFSIEKTGEWDYQVTEVIVVSQQTEPGHSATTGSSKAVQTQGEIKQVMPEARMLSIVHDPIPEWQWPVMNMMLSVAENQSIDGLSVGQRISFRLLETENGDYIVDNIQAME